MMESTHTSNSSAHSAQTVMASNASTNDPDAKVLSDLSTLNEQITLCQSMLVNAGSLPSIRNDEALLTVIGFLEACVPRMVELIEAAAQGALKPGTFEECLTVNDRLTNILGDVEKDPGDRTPLTPAATAASSSAAAAGSASSGGVGDSTSSIDEGMMNKLSLVGDSSRTVGEKTTGLDDEADADPFAGGPDLLDPTPATEAEKAFVISDSMGSAEENAAEKPKAEDDDDFDAFFKERTTAP